MRIVGAVPAYIFMITNQTYPVISIGYIFVKNAPYFTLTAWPADGFTERLEDRDSVSNSEKMTFLFTKNTAT